MHVAPGPAEIVAGLQRSVGNRAVARFLARQEEAEPMGPPVPIIPRRLDPEDPVISTVLGPILGEHGRYRWLVRYQLLFAAEREGWLIQELHQESHTGAGLHFWECWRVRAGEQEPADAATEDGVTYDDRYVHGGGGATPDARGWHRHVGVIRFYPGPKPPEFRGSPSAHFDTTHTQPSGWTGQGTRHDAYAEWDYSEGRRRRNGFVGYAGATEVRAGDHVTFQPRAGGGPTRLETEPEAVPQRL